MLSARKRNRTVKVVAELVRSTPVMGRRRVAGALLLVGALVFGMAPTAGADKVGDLKQQAANLADQRDRMNHEAERLAELYNKARVERADLQSQIDQIRAKLAAQDVQIGELNTKLAKFAVQTYMYGDQASGLGSLLSAEDAVSNVAQRRGYSPVVLGSSVDVGDVLKATREDTDRLRADLAAKEAQQAKLEKQIVAKRDAAAKAATAASELLTKTNADLRQALIEEEQRRQAEAAQRTAEEARKVEDERRLAEQQRKAEEAEVAQMEVEREAEADRIDEALRKAREARAKRTGIESAPYVASDDAADERRRIESRDVVPDVREERPPSGLGAGGMGSRHVTAPTSSTRVAVLLTMTAGNRGIRRHNKTGDPILCGERGCYVSTGADGPAELFPLRRAFGAGRTLGDRAGACRNSLGCVFRDVDLVAFPAIVQPVDMRFLRHDRRQPQVLHETSACRLEAGRLACTAIHGPDYTMWVVPEEIATAAGPAVLERAVEDGLQSDDAPVLRSVRN